MRVCPARPIGDTVSPVLWGLGTSTGDREASQPLQGPLGLDLVTGPGTAAFEPVQAQDSLPPPTPHSAPQSCPLTAPAPHSSLGVIHSHTPEFNADSSNFQKGNY